MSQDNDGWAFWHRFLKTNSGPFQKFAVSLSKQQNGLKRSRPEAGSPRWGRPNGAFHRNTECPEISSATDRLPILTRPSPHKWKWLRRWAEKRSPRRETLLYAAPAARAGYRFRGRAF